MPPGRLLLVLVLLTIAVPSGIDARRRKPPPDPFRFIHFQRSSPGSPLSWIELRLTPEVSELSVVYLGQRYQESRPPDSALRETLVRALLETEIWPRWDGAPRACLAFGHGPTTREATLGPYPTPDPVMARVESIVELEALLLAYHGELSHYLTDEPSLAAGTIDQLAAGLRTHTLLLDTRLQEILATIAEDRTVRPLVRDAAETVLEFGRGLAFRSRSPVEEPPSDLQPVREAEE